MHAFLWQKGLIRDLGTLGGTFSQAYGVNDLGQVVGISTIPGSETTHETRAFLWQNGTMVDLLEVTRGFTALAAARKINEAGQLVGFGSQDNQLRGFIWDRGFARDLGNLGGDVTDAMDINNHGIVVGTVRCRRLFECCCCTQSLLSYAAWGGSYLVESLPVGWN